MENVSFSRTNDVALLKEFISISTITSQFPNAAKVNALDVRLGLLLNKQGYEKSHTRTGNMYNVTSVVA